MGDEEEIVLTPLRGAVRCQVISVARIPRSRLDTASVQHMAGGPYKGIVISRARDEKPDPGPPETKKSFTAIVGDGKSNSREWRELRFWFQPESRAIPQVRDAITDTFFKELMQPNNFPKDYVGFMKRVLTLVKQYTAILKVELEMRPLAPEEQGPTTIRRRKQITMTMYSETLTNGSSGGGGGSSHVVAQTVAGSGRRGNPAYERQLRGGQDDIEEDVVVAQATATTGGRGNPAYEQQLLAARTGGGGTDISPLYSYHTAKLLACEGDEPPTNTGGVEMRQKGGGSRPVSARRSTLMPGQMPSQEDIRVLLYSEDVTNEQLEETLLAAGYIRAPGAGKSLLMSRGLAIQENIHFVIRQEILAGEDLRTALYNAGYVPDPLREASELFVEQTEDDIQRLLYQDTLTIDELNIALAQAGFVRAPDAVYRQLPGSRAQEDLRTVLMEETDSGQTLQGALFVAGFVPKVKAGDQLFQAPGRSEEDLKKLLVKKTLTFDELNIAIDEAGFQRAPAAGVLRYPGVKGQEDLKLYLKEEVTAGMDLEQALWNVGYVASPAAGATFTARGRSQDDIKQILYKDTLTFDELNVALTEAGFARSPDAGAVVLQPGIRCQEDLRIVLKQEINDGLQIQDALFVAGFIPKPEEQEKLFVARSEDEVRSMLSTASLTVEELEVTLEEAGFYRPPGLSVANRPAVQEDMCFLINREVESGATLEEALYKAGYMKAPTKAAGGTKLKRAPTISKKGWEMLWQSKKQRVLQILEDAYPNVTTAADLMKLTEMKRNNIDKLLIELQTEKKIQELDKDKWIRVHAEVAPSRKDKAAKDELRTASMIAEEDDLASSEDEETKVLQTQRKHDIKMVTHIPHLPRAEQPTIALITLLYCEKLAVDAMMTQKTTYIRYKTEGEGQVYTVGKIGKHRVVATKLARIGFKQDAMTAAGNAITRMLGTFGELEYVILVGVGGGVREDPSHVIGLGDVLVSLPDQDSGPLYIHCAKSQMGDAGKYEFLDVQQWTPRESVLQDIVDGMQRDGTDGGWREHFNDAMRFLKGGQTNFTRPAPETDKYYVAGEAPADTAVFTGVVGSGKAFSKDDNLRRQFALTYQCKVIDSGFQAVMESIQGNRKDNFLVVRGVSDYHDGTTRREWQPYAALAAAAFAKHVIARLPVEDEDSD